MTDTSWLPREKVVGTNEIAVALNVKPATVATWRFRDRLEFPEPDMYVSGTPAWWWPTIEKWAKAHDRLP